MSKTTRSIIDTVDANPDVDNSEEFIDLWNLLSRLKQELGEEFELHEDPSSDGLQPYRGLPDSGGASGFMSHFAGPEIDWLVHSWVGNPKHSFSNMHLTISLGAQFDVPHLGLAFGTTPDLFFYMDYMPRKDLWMNPEYMDRYYLEANEQFLELHNDKRFNSFFSRDTYTRVAQTATSLCFIAPLNDQVMETVEHHVRAMLDRWVGWVKNTAPQHESLWQAQAERDLQIRRTISERDPMNRLAERLLGKPLTERLVRALWGGDRVLPRAHKWRERSQS